MPINSKPLSSLSEVDFHDLVSNQVMENRTLEYKEALPGNSDEDKREFLADVSAFANTSGGDIVYGIKEDAGIAFEVCGLEVDDVDATLLRLQNTLRTGIDPKIAGVQIEHFPIQNNRIVIVIRIPRSWALLHMVVFKGSSKFFARNASGKYPLDVRQIRDGFLFGETLKSRVREFRYERLEVIDGDNPSIELEGLDNGYLALHIVPLEVGSINSQFDVNSLINNFPQPLSPFSQVSRRLNFDGLLSFDVSNSRTSSRSYVQTFRNGAIEAVDATMTNVHNQTAYIDPAYEPKVLAGLRRFLAVQQQLGVEPPLFVGLSFLGVRGHYIGIQQQFGRSSGEPIDRDNLIVPEVIVEDYDVSLTKLMKPAFDAIWNAADWQYSLNYNVEGQWIGGQI